MRIKIEIQDIAYKGTSDEFDLLVAKTTKLVHQTFREFHNHFRHNLEVRIRLVGLQGDMIHETSLVE